jgi:hypothetical protein
MPESENLIDNMRNSIIKTSIMVFITNMLTIKEREVMRMQKKIKRMMKDCLKKKLQKMMS